VQKKVVKNEEENDGGKEYNLGKDEIMQALNLGNADMTVGGGKHGADSKNAITKDLIDNMTKDLEKLKRQSENIQLRRTIAQKGGHWQEPTEEEKDTELHRVLKN